MLAGFDGNTGSGFDCESALDTTLGDQRPALTHKCFSTVRLSHAQLRPGLPRIGGIGGYVPLQVSAQF